MSNVVKTVTVVQELDADDNVVKETTTIVTLGQPAEDFRGGMYL